MIFNNQKRFPLDEPVSTWNWASHTLKSNIRRLNFLGDTKRIALAKATECQKIKSLETAWTLAA